MPRFLFHPICPSALFAGVLLAGCSANTPPANLPQLQTPTLSGRQTPTNPATSRKAADVAAAAALPPLKPVATPEGTFSAAPYIQWGTDADAMTLHWETTASQNAPQWTVETAPAGTADWKLAASNPSSHAYGDQTLWRVPLTHPAPGSLFDYRVLQNNTPVFVARARFRPAKNDTSDFRVVVFGDCGAATTAQKKIAYQTHQAKPDFVFITGDIVYDAGRVSEYQQKFFPIYNANVASPQTGAPLLRSTLFLASPGNHDVQARNLGKFSDGMAYFALWSQPLNGPELPKAVTPELFGAEGDKKAFLAAAGPNYPRMANFSFDWGNSHWVVLDANPYINGSDKTLRAWLDKDFAQAKTATWRFVAFHQPPFNSSPKHRGEEQMRRLCDVFEKNKVDIVFSGHVHNYQRTFPLTFEADEKSPPTENKLAVPGKWKLDKTFDGDKKTVPHGVLYLITGGGGESLYNPELDNHPENWQPFTCKYFAAAHSLTQLDVRDKSLVVRQITDEGVEVDKFIVTKPIEKPVQEPKP